MYKWFLAWRYLHTKLIAFFGIASVMLCVAMVLVVMSVMGGFLDTIRARHTCAHRVDELLDICGRQGVADTAASEPSAVLNSAC